MCSRKGLSVIQTISRRVRFAASRKTLFLLLTFFVSAPAVSSAGDPVAHAVGLTASFFISAPGVEGPGAIPGLTLENFDSITSGNKTTGTALAIGTISANTLTVHNCTVGPTCWAGASTDTATPTPIVNPLPASTPNSNYPYNNKTPFAYPSSQVTIELVRAVNYFGFYWAAGSGSNTVKLYSGSTLVASFSTADLNTLIPTSRVASGATVTANGGSVYNVDDYRGGHKSSWDSWYTAAGVNCSLASSNTWSVNCWNPQQFAYVHAVVPQGFTFDKVQLIANDFEFDNLAIANYTGTFDPTGLVGIPLSAASSAPSLGPATQTVTFDANDGSGATATQASSSSASLRANTFTRSGYTFAGWMTSPTGSVIDHADQGTYSFSASTTLYAKWVAVQATTTTAPSTTVPVVTTTTVATQSAAQVTTTSIAPVSVTTKATRTSGLPKTGSRASDTALNLGLTLLFVGAALSMISRRRLRRN